MSKKSTPRCPKCRNVPMQYVEIWDRHTITFESSPDGNPADEGEMAEGEPVAVEARCLCGHTWRLRGVMQIDDVRSLY